MTANICVPVLKRYDLLRRMLLSLTGGTIVPARIVIIDNGKNADALRVAMENAFEQKYTAPMVLTPAIPMGVAESWNWFIDNVPEERVIVNDDVMFASDSLEKLIERKDLDLIWADGCGFSCFVLRDACVRKIGRFDETISPGYAYYEDEDYLQRLDGRGTRAPSARSAKVVCGVRHEKSATLKASSVKETMEHHRKFTIAQRNYMKKWNISEQEMFGGTFRIHA